MPVDHSAWLRAVDAEASQAPARSPLIHPAFAQHLRAVAARMEHLTDGDAWRVYRAQLETLIEELEQQTAGLRAQMDEMFGHDHDRARLRLADLRGQITGLRTALQAPEVVAETAQRLSHPEPA